MAFRPRRILSVARRDLRFEFKGRQGFILPSVIATLLLPVSIVPIPETDILDQEPDVVSLSGDVPAEVVALPSTRVVDRAKVRFREQRDGRLVVYGPYVPNPVRAVLDGDEPVIEREELPHGFVFPGRTMLFSLISASTLTGAVSTSIGGERSRKTLVVLLSLGPEPRRDRGGEVAGVGPGGVQHRAVRRVARGGPRQRRGGSVAVAPAHRAPGDGGPGAVAGAPGQRRDRGQHGFVAGAAGGPRRQRPRGLVPRPVRIPTWAPWCRSAER